MHGLCICGKQEIVVSILGQGPTARPQWSTVSRMGNAMSILSRGVLTSCSAMRPLHFSLRTQAQDPHRSRGKKTDSEDTPVVCSQWQLMASAIWSFADTLVDPFRVEQRQPQPATTSHIPFR